MLIKLAWKHFSISSTEKYEYASYQFFCTSTLIHRVVICRREIRIELYEY